MWLSASRRWELKAWWNNQVKGEIKRKDDAWKGMLRARDEDARKRCLEMRKIKRFIYQSKAVQEQFGRKMNQDMNGNRKLFWKEISKENGGSGEFQQNKGWK